MNRHVWFNDYNDITSYLNTVINICQIVAKVATKDHKPMLDSRDMFSARKTHRWQLNIYTKYNFTNI